MIARHALLLPAAAILAACSAQPAPGENASDVAPSKQAAAPAIPPARPADPVLAIDGEGLRLFNPATGAARPIAFGTPRQATLAALAFRGTPRNGETLSECGAGPLDPSSWDDDLTVYFQEEKFVGWALRGKARGTLTTAAGIGPGSTRAELESAYAAKIFDSTLGTEFGAGDLFGILDGTGAGARITNLWAGASCNMR